MDTKKELGIVLEFIPTNRDELIPKLVDGYGDIAAAGLTITDQRRRLVDFTLPYLSGVNEVVVTHKGAAKLSKIEDLAGLGILVRKSSSYYESLLALNKKLDFSFYVCYASNYGSKAPIFRSRLAKQLQSPCDNISGSWSRQSRC